MELQELVNNWLDDPDDGEQLLVNYVSDSLYTGFKDLVPTALWEDGGDSPYETTCDEVAEEILGLLRIVRNTVMDRSLQEC